MWMCVCVVNVPMMLSVSSFCWHSSNEIIGAIITHVYDCDIFVMFIKTISRNIGKITKLCSVLWTDIMVCEWLKIYQQILRRIPLKPPERAELWLNFRFVCIKSSQNSWKNDEIWNEFGSNITSKTIKFHWKQEPSLRAFPFNLPNLSLLFNRFEFLLHS